VGRVIGSVLLVLALAAPAAADPQGIAHLLIYDNPWTHPNVIQADLVTQPGAIVYGVHVAEHITDVPFELVFATNDPGTYTITMSLGDLALVTYPTVTGGIPIFNTPPQLFGGMGTQDPCCSYHDVVPGLITVSLNGGPAVDYPFGLVDPVPEPATLWLLGGPALGWLAWRRRWPS